MTESHNEHEPQIFVVAPSHRCDHAPLHGPGTPCGKLAVCFRQGATPDDTSYRCRKHSTPHDQLIPAGAIGTRVRVTACVDLAGVARNPSVCEAEAVAQLEQALAAIGGRLNVLGVSLARGQFGVRPPAGAPSASQGQR